MPFPAREAPEKDSSAAKETTPPPESSGDPSHAATSSIGRASRNQSPDNPQAALRTIPESPPSPPVDLERSGFQNQSRPRNIQPKPRSFRRSMRESEPEVHADTLQNANAIQGPRKGPKSRTSGKQIAQPTLRAPLGTENGRDVRSQRHSTPRSMKSSMRSSMPPSDLEHMRPVSQGRTSLPSAPRHPENDPFTSPTPRTEPKRFALSKPMPRRDSNGSDSSSSFKRSRRRKDAGDRYTMRRSMRSAGREASPNRASSGAFARKEHPPEPTSKSPKMRMTLRGSQTSQPRETSAPLTSRTKGPKEPVQTLASERPKSSWRWSSANNEASPQPYRSRFADSSDEDEPTPLSLAPVRGIPRTGEDGNSTDLEDSDEEPKRVTKSPQKPPSRDAAPPKNETALRNGRLASLDTSNLNESARSPDAKRKSWFSIGRKKKDGSRVGKTEIESAAQRDTPLERSKQARGQSSQDDEASTHETPAASTSASPLPSPRVGRLTRRYAPQRVASDSWPFPQAPALAGGDARPVTSDGAGSPTATRPALAARQMSSGSNVPPGVVSEKTGKKKRFPMLRKAFGLHN